MAYKYKINPVTGKLDLVGTEGGGITNITSEDGTITVTTSGNTVDLAAPSLKMLEGYACGFGSSGGSGYAKFCDLYWTNLNGAVSSLPQFHVNYHKFGGGGGIYYTADLCLIFGNEGSGVQVCHAIIENEIAYADSADIPSTTIEQYRPSNIIKVDYIKTATRGGQGDPKTDIGFGHAVICCHWDWTNTNVHLHPLSSKAILYNNSNLCYFELNPECVVGRCSNYTVQGTIQPAKVAGGSSQPQSSIIYKGTIGTGGTITTLPTASSENAGWQYKVITAGTYSGIEANINDSFISNGSTWTLAKGSEDISKIGDLNDLTTSVKTSVVAAVNEVNEKVGSICNESTTSQAEEIVISNDSESEDYIKMGSYGIKAKEYLDLDGNQISGYNLLKSKKWAVIGDSFSTNADSPVSSDSYIVGGKYNGKLKDYGYIIGNRNHMDLTILHRAGKTMALPADGTFQNSICSETDSQSYLNIPSDVDYITIQLGINDVHHLAGDASQDGEDITGAITLGTIDSTDISTFYGAWNYICEWILTNRPFAHYGIIITNGIPSTNKDFYDAEIEIAEKWGIPYLDLNGDERCPAMHRATNSKMCQKAKDLRLSNFTEGATGTHPNYKAHEYESTFIENFLRSI